VNTGLTVSRLVTAALRPASIAGLARLRRAEALLAGAEPGPMVVAVMGAAANAGASTVTALLARALAALAPGQVAVVDGDGVKQSQRTLLDAGSSGGLGQLLSAAPAWRSRRAIEEQLARGGGLPVLALAAAEREWIPRDELELAVRLLRRRYPVVVADLPFGHGHYEWAVTADHVIVVGGADRALQQAASWVRANRGGRSTVVVATGMAPSARAPRGVDVVFPTDRALTRAFGVDLVALQWSTMAAIEEIVARIVPAGSRRSEPWTDEGMVLTQQLNDL
jgi:hypothetical protein